MALRRFHFLNPMIHSQTQILKGWPGDRLVKIGLATRPSIAKSQFQNSFVFFLGVWVKLVALSNSSYLSIRSLPHLSFIGIIDLAWFSSSLNTFVSKYPFGWPWANLWRCLRNHREKQMTTVCLCTAEKLQCCHMLARWTLHAQPSPPFIQQSFEQ